MFHDQHKDLFKRAWAAHVQELAAAYLTRGDDLVVLIILADSREKPTMVISTALKVLSRDEVLRDMPEPHDILASWDQILKTSCLPLVLHIVTADGLGYSEILGLSKRPHAAA